MKDYLNLPLIRSRIVIILLSVFSFGSATVSVAEPVPVVEDHFSIGAGAVYNSAPYEGYDGYATPMPFFDIRFGRFFAFNNHDEPIVGWELFRHKRVMLAVAATRSRAILEVDEINKDKDHIFFGIEDKDEAIEAGLIFRFYSRVGIFEAATYHDVVSAYGGTKSSLSISRPFPDTGNWSIVPRFFLKHYSEKFNQYYYSVTKAENDIGKDLAALEGIQANVYESLRPVYNPGNSGHVGAELNIEYNFSEHVIGVGYIGIEKFSGEIETSPLIEDKELVTTSLGLRYTF